MKKKNKATQDAEPIPMLSAKKYADFYELPLSTVNGWLKAGRIEGAEPVKVDGVIVRWRVPQNAPHPTERKIGRPKKEVTEPTTKGKKK